MAVQRRARRRASPAKRGAGLFKRKGTKLQCVLAQVVGTDIILTFNMEVRIAFLFRPEILSDGNTARNWAESTSLRTLRQVRKSQPQCRKEQRPSVIGSNWTTTSERSEETTAKCWTTRQFR